MSTKQLLCPPHAAWCAWVHDEVLAEERGLFPIIEHACNCPARVEWEQGEPARLAPGALDLRERIR